MTMERFVKKWNGKAIQEGGFLNNRSYASFVKDFRSAITNTAKGIGASQISFYRGYDVVSGFLYRNNSYVYYNFSVPKNGRRLNLKPVDGTSDKILIRTATTAHDLLGDADNLADAEEFEVVANWLLS